MQRAGPHTVLNPLNSLGLWLPVIMTAPSASRCTAEKYSSGVGTTPISVTSQPESIRPSSRASRRRGELRRQSRPRLIERAALALQQGSQAAAQVGDVGAQQFRLRDAADVVFAENGRFQHAL